MPKKSNDLDVIKNLSPIKIWGEDFEKLYELKKFKGKFVISAGGKMIAKILPLEKYNKADIYHSTMLEELGIEKPESLTMKKKIVGGGKIELELIEDYVECRFYGKSTAYGLYSPTNIDVAKMEKAIEATFNLGMMPVLVIPNFEGEPVFS